ncbi:iron response transcriptional regulator IrrA [Zavarzinia compransoris]|uniref:Ferric uptake regulation protein n=1 Tax=Zavarzinia compransoris TaxID=1264899 RepID=A0A317E1D7_9PROT|nr:Fur family transcriptional regulator [Zavarzinia compransoris]PWR20907.1 transcriptional repressor [Zavarzinia compransoris]TDP44255.1 Fur family iron response transcriptional regulator [Zavarzinia compransoris]
MNRTQGPERPFRDALQRLKAAGLRPTRQRLALTRILFENGHRHVTAENLHAEAKTAGVDVSLATIYNTLHQFTTVGLLREVVIDTGKAYFDTNTDDHHHFFFEDSGRLADIPGNEVAIANLPSAPEGMEVARVDVVIRLRGTGRLA